VPRLVGCTGLLEVHASGAGAGRSDRAAFTAARPRFW